MPMLDPQLMGLEPCSCGRIKIKMHCPRCGSYTCEVRARLRSVHRAFSDKISVLSDREVATLRREKMITDNDEVLPVYKCRRCAHEFDETQWGSGLCNAPVYDSSTARKQRRLHEKAQRNLSLTGGADEESRREISNLIFSGSPEQRMLGFKKLHAKPRKESLFEDRPLPSFDSATQASDDSKSISDEEAEAILRDMDKEKE